MTRGRIIIVEDEIIIATDIKRTLEAGGYEVPALSKYGEEAIAASEKFHPDLILMDIMLAGPMNGIEAARRIRASIDVPVIYMTANADDRFVQQARDTEPYGYLNKPVQERDLITNIDSALNRHRIERRLHANEERYRALVDSIPDIIISLDENTVITYISPPAEGMTGYPIHEIVGKSLINFLAPSDLSRALDAFERLKKGELTTNEYYFLRKNGTEIWVRAKSRPLFLNGGFTGITSILTDITEQQVAHEELLLKHEELRYAMDELSRANAELTLSNERIAEREHEYHSLFTSMLEGSAIHTLLTGPGGETADYMIDDVNPGFEKSLGMKREDVIGKPASQVYKMTPPPYLETYARVALSGRAETFETYFPLLGRYFRISAYSPAPQRFVTIFEDITQRKRDEDLITASLHEKEVLIREIHHRVKNNFQLIMSMLNLQQRHITDEILVREFLDAKNRIRAMAMIHERLYRSENLTRIDLTSYIQAIIRDLLVSYPNVGARIRLDFSLDRLEIGITKAAPCGLIINEIVTNTLKFAFPAEFAGEPVLRVELRVTDGGTVTITLSDNGVGIPEGITPERATTLGLSMVTMLAQQINAGITIDRDRGTRCTLKFTLA
jgi:PAS domain S-box-containing protein